VDTEAIRRLRDRVFAARPHSIPLREWMGLPPDAAVEEIREVALRRWRANGLSEAEVASGLREVFGEDDTWPGCTSTFIAAWGPGCVVEAR